MNDTMSTLRDMENKLDEIDEAMAALKMILPTSSDASEDKDE